MYPSEHQGGFTCQRNVTKCGTETILVHKNQIPSCCWKVANERGNVRYVPIPGPVRRWEGGPYEVPRVLPPQHFQEAFNFNLSRAQYRWPGPSTFPSLDSYPLAYDFHTQLCPHSSLYHKFGPYERVPKACDVGYHYNMPTNYMELGAPFDLERCTLIEHR